MKVSAKAEYACLALMELAANHGDNQPVRIKTIADAHGISQRFLVQILLQLKTAGLVASVRGAAGGYQLALPPEGITLADILNAVEDRTQGVRSALSENSSSAAARTLLGVWKDVQAEEQRLLEGLTLAELLRRSREGADLSYQI
jgi:Rrf2 family protein